MKNGNTIGNIIQDLEHNKPDEGWQSWLMGIQNSMIYNGNMEALTRKGSECIATKFGALKNFFDSLEQLNKTD